MPNYDLGLLITLDISLSIIGLSIAVIGIWIISRQVAVSTTELARIAERIDARLRRQYPDIDSDLNEQREPVQQPCWLPIHF